ncbi:SymE family type I addiction module toxin [Xanthomonas vasicola]|uniref:SymE family type I addiction module toxin n=1 Tax=Xanthomonas vasicola TaxID=56459 RepID=UPI003CE4BD00
MQRAPTQERNRRHDAVRLCPTSGKHRYHQLRTLNPTATQDGGTSRPPRKARAPTRCTVGYAFYDAAPGRPHSQRIPSVRLRGLWLEQFGFAVGSKLRITARNGELVVTVAED